MLRHRLDELLLHIVDVDSQVRACVLDRLRRLFLSGCLALDLDSILKRMGLAIACELDGAIAQKLMPHDVA